MRIDVCRIALEELPSAQALVRLSTAVRARGRAQLWAQFMVPFDDNRYRGQIEKFIH
jgi:hypothetical protein